MENQSGNVEFIAEALKRPKTAPPNLERDSSFEVPTGDSVGEIFRVFVLRKDDLGLHTKDTAIGGHQEGFDVTAVFLIVDLSKLPPDCAIGDFFRSTFQNYRFVRFFRCNDDVGESGDVFGLACAWAGAEPEGITPPDSPYNHEMRTAIGSRGGDPIIVRLLEALEGPRPGFQAGCVLGRLFEGIRPVGSADSWFEHGESFRDRRSR